jgi:branched-subunit amino acid aminotransferase/4-amino-4-deoxychorismate lyase
MTHAAAAPGDSHQAGENQPGENQAGEIQPGENQAGDIAWLDGRRIPRADLVLPVGDAGFVLGATVTEQLRTFGGRLFLPEWHAERFAGSLAIAGIEPARPAAEIFAAAAEIARHNHALGDPGGDLGVVVFATPGDLPAQHGGRGSPPRAAVHSFPLAFSLWARAYADGVALRSVPVAQVPGASWPLALKCRSRMHYHLADRAAAAVEPGARAILCHTDGRVSETSTANLAIVRGGRIVTPPPADALPGVSLRFCHDLATELGLEWEERSLALADLAAADEVLLTSSPNCLLPGTRLDGRPIGAGGPGPVFRRLLSAWSERVGVDIAGQARKLLLPSPRVGE